MVELARRREITEWTYCCWRAKYGRKESEDAGKTDPRRNFHHHSSLSNDRFLGGFVAGVIVSIALIVSLLLLILCSTSIHRSLLFLARHFSWVVIQPMFMLVQRRF